MKGVVLCGGLGTRLSPITKITNKHLLPVYDKPMVFYPIAKRVDMGIDDILIVTGGTFAGDFLRLLGNGKEFGLHHVNYAYQEGEGGIADALRLARHWADEAPVCVILGDNIFADSLSKARAAFEKQGAGAKIFLKKVPDPERFGVPTLDGRTVVKITEKPKKPASSYAVIGAYMYDEQVWKIIETLKPSGRGELEITDVNNAYIKRGQMTYEILRGYWTDAGTFPSLLKASNLVAKHANRSRGGG